jgi:succinate dehydrogenase flavin-adding protein (antitoxin of CptAB toxin-antitoxin module)
MSEELLTNPFLRCEDPEILDYLQKNAGLQEREPEEVFARIRLLRNDFS